MANRLRDEREQNEARPHAPTGDRRIARGFWVIASCLLVVALLVSTRSDDLPRTPALAGASTRSEVPRAEHEQPASGASAAPASLPVAREDAGASAPLENDDDHGTFSGVVVYRDTRPVSGAGLAVGLGAVWNHQRLEATADHDGRFRIVIPRPAHPEALRGLDAQAHLLVWDSLSTVYDGLITIADDVVVRCRTAPGDLEWNLEGWVEPQSLAHDEAWIAMLWACPADGSATYGLASSGCYGPLHGPGAIARLRFLRTGNWHYTGPVALALYTQRDAGPRVPFCALPFGSAAAFGSALRAGIVVPCPLRRFTVADVHDLPVDLLTLSLPGQGFRAIALKRQPDGFTGRLPPGEYFARGFVDRERWGEALLQIGDEANVQVRWTTVRPGPASVTIQLRDPAGHGVAGATVEFSRVDSNGRVIESGTLGATSDALGRATASGICTGRYVWKATEGSARGHAESLIDDVASEVCIEMAEVASVDVRIADARRVGLDDLPTEQCQLLYRQDAGPWIEHPRSRFSLASWTISDLRVGSRVDVALRGTSWVGAATVARVVAGAQQMELPVVATYPLSGSVANMPAGRVEAVLDYPHVGPWDACAIEADGGFELRERLDPSVPAPRLRIVVDGETVWSAELDGSRPRPLRIRL